jgi:hypothetical protein
VRQQAIYSVLGSAKLNGIDPEAYMTLVLRRIADHPINRIRDLLLWNLFPAASAGSGGGMTVKTVSTEIVPTIGESWARFKMRERLRG